MIKPCSSQKIWLKKYIILTLIIISLIIFFIYFYQKRQIDANSIALLIAAGVAAWYANETMLLRKESIRQSEGLIAPFIVFQWDSRLRNYSGAGIVVKNIGKGLARNILIKDRIIENQFFKKIYHFGQISVIEPIGSSQNFSRDLKVKESIKVKKTTIDQSILDPDYLDTKLDYILYLSYEDIEGNKYESKIQADSTINDNFKVIEYRKS